MRESVAVFLERDLFPVWGGRSFGRFDSAGGVDEGVGPFDNIVGEEEGEDNDVFSVWAVICDKWIKNLERNLVR